MESESLTKTEESTTVEKTRSPQAESVAPAKCSYQKGRTKKPKRNKSAFILFSIEMRAKLKLNNDQLNSNEMMVKLAELWKNLPKTEREAYYTEAKDDKLRYLRELDNFSKAHPSESIHNRTKKNHIKKPCSAYAIFLREKKGIIREQKPELKMADILKIVSKQWQSLKDDERSIYKEKALEEKETVRTKLGESLDKKNLLAKNNLNLQKKIKSSDKNVINLVDVKEIPKSQFKIGSTGDLRVHLENMDFAGHGFDRTLSTMASLRSSDAMLPKDFSLLDKSSRLLSSLFNFQMPEMNNTSTKDHEIDEGGKSLLKLFDRAVQKSSELLVDLFNFTLPTESFDSLNLAPRSSTKSNFDLLFPQAFRPAENGNGSLFSKNPGISMPRPEVIHENGITAATEKAPSPTQKESAAVDMKPETETPVQTTC